jgi:hypothetical protein
MRRPRALLCLVALSLAAAVARGRRGGGAAGRALRAARAACARAHEHDASDDALLACVSRRCRDAVYGDDPLEEGEFCPGRMARFEACARAEARGRPPVRGGGGGGERGL